MTTTETKVNIAMFIGDKPFSELLSLMHPMGTRLLYGANRGLVATVTNGTWTKQDFLRFVNISKKSLDKEKMDLGFIACEDFIWVNEAYNTYGNAEGTFTLKPETFEGKERVELTEEIESGSISKD